MDQLMMKQMEYQPNTSQATGLDALSRLRDGKTAWNSWAKALLAEKKALEDVGKWQLERVWSDQHGAIIAKSDIAETEDWLQRARVDFSGLTITSRVKEYLDNRNRIAATDRHNHVLVLEGENIDFSGFIFPGEVLFQGCLFRTATSFDHARFCSDAVFNQSRFDGAFSAAGTRFEGDAWFENTHFQASASFEDVGFYLAAWFTAASCKKKLKFRQCLFIADLWLNDAVLKGRTGFEKCFFKSDLVLNETTFKGRAFFKELRIEGEAFLRETRFAGRAEFENITHCRAALYTQCDFAGYTIFHNCKFHRTAFFKAIHVAKGFVMEDVSFLTEVPNLRQAMFREPARLKDIEILPAPRRRPFEPSVRAVLKAVKRERKWLRKLFFIDRVHTNWIKARLRFYKERFTNARRKPTDETYFKTLTRLAVEARNRRAEKQFVAGQIRARRHMKDKLIGIPAGTFNYLTGVISELTSNFGRSLIRPALAWSIVFACFTGIYLKEAINPITGSCNNQEDLTPIMAAQAIGLQNAFRLDWQPNDRMDNVHRCLYGMTKVTVKQSKDQTRLAGLYDVPAPPPPPEPKVPVRVIMLGFVHSALSFVILGVFLINLRNRFKMVVS